MNESKKSQALLSRLIAMMAAGISDEDAEKMLGVVDAQPPAKKRGRPKKPPEAHIQPIPELPDKLSLSVEEAGALIGIPRSAVYEYIARGDLPAFKLGKRRLILLTDLKAWINSKAKEGRR